MQTLPGFARKYAIMEELDSGFGAGSVPEAFVRLDSWEGRIQASIHVKGLKTGPYVYRLYLIFAKGDVLIPILAGSLNSSYNGMQGGLEIDSQTLKSNGIAPDSVRYAAITAENRDKKWIPLFSSFEKSYKWDESIRQVLLKKPADQEPREEQRNYFFEAPRKMEDEPACNDPVPVNQSPKAPEAVDSGITPEPQRMAPVNDPYQVPVNISKPSGNDQSSSNQLPSGNQQSYNNPLPSGNMQSNIPQSNNQQPENALNNENMAHSQEQKPIQRERRPYEPESRYNRCDIGKLEGLLQNNFEACEPFRRSSRGYSWYRVSDLAKLSNIMYITGVNVPVFANPKILVGLFKFKHILAGLYKGDNGANYFVIGVPAKNETDNKPFERACRWVPLNNSEIRDMGGYWLVYVSMRTGEIVV